MSSLNPAQMAERVGFGQLMSQAAGQRQRLLQAGGGLGKAAGQLLHPAKVGEGDRFGEPVAGAAGQRQRLLAAGEGGWVVAGQLVHHAQVIEGVSLAGLIARPRRTGPPLG